MHTYMLLNKCLPHVNSMVAKAVAYFVHCYQSQLVAHLILVEFEFSLN